MIIDCIADLHGHYPKLEGGDLLIVAGDLTTRDTYDEYNKIFHWLVQQDYKKAIVIAGNHDNKIQEGYIPILSFNDFGMSEVEYLCDSGTEFEGLKIWGSPWTKTFEGMNPHCKAFTCETEEELAEKWTMIPDDVDILITHSPPYGILDEVKLEDQFKLSEPPLQMYEHVGSKSLRNKTLNGKYFKNFRHHIFGHIHEMGGFRLDLGITRFINCSHVNEQYQPVNKPVRVIL